MTIMEKIQKELDRRDWSIRQLALKIGMKPTQLNRVMRGEKGAGLTVKRVLAIARVLDLPMDYLIDDEMSEPDPERWLDAKTRGLLDAFRKTGLLEKALGSPGYKLDSERPSEGES